MNCAVPEFVTLNKAGSRVPLTVNVLLMVMFDARVTVVPALIVIFLNSCDTGVPLIVCEVPAKMIGALLLEVEYVPLFVQFPLTVKARLF